MEGVRTRMVKRVSDTGHRPKQDTSYVEDSEKNQSGVQRLENEEATSKADRSSRSRL